MLTKRLCATAVTAAALAGVAANSVLPGVASAATSGSVPLPGGPIVRAVAPGNSSIPTISLNWSGYAATSAKKFTYVHSTFVQPAITCPGVKNEWTSNWVGLDGFNNATVEQDGTFAHCGGPQSTAPVYQAWYEMYPAGSVNVFRVQPGDVIDTSVTYTHGKFSLTVSDLTTGKTATDVAACASCQRASAEWIIERPALCNNALTKCFLTRLADFGTSTMGGTEAQVAGGGEGHRRVPQLPDQHGHAAGQRGIHLAGHGRAAEPQDVHRDLGPLRRHSPDHPGRQAEAARRGPGAGRVNGPPRDRGSGLTGDTAAALHSLWANPFRPWPKLRGSIRRLVETGAPHRTGRAWVGIGPAEHTPAPYP